METKWHLRVRAVVYQNDKFLVIRAKGGNVFLLGGHVEIGESLTNALEREIMEEANRKCEIKEYLGAIESTYIKDEIKHWEIVHFFHTVITDLKNSSDILPAEDDFDFLWITPSEFEKLNLLPVPLRELMENWANGDKKIWWASTVN